MNCRRQEPLHKAPFQKDISFPPLPDSLLIAKFRKDPRLNKKLDIKNHCFLCFVYLVLHLYKEDGYISYIYSYILRF